MLQKVLLCALCGPIRRGNVAPAHAISSLNPVEEPPGDSALSVLLAGSHGLFPTLLEIGTLVIIENPWLRRSFLL